MPRPPGAGPVGSSGNAAQARRSESLPGLPNSPRGPLVGAPGAQNPGRLPTSTYPGRRGWKNRHDAYRPTGGSTRTPGDRRAQHHSHLPWTQARGGSGPAAGDRGGLHVLTCTGTARPFPSRSRQDRRRGSKKWLGHLISREDQKVPLYSPHKGPVRGLGICWQGAGAGAEETAL